MEEKEPYVPRKKTKRELRAEKFDTIGGMISVAIMVWMFIWFFMNI